MARCLPPSGTRLALIVGMADTYALQILIILALIPFVIVGLHCLLEARTRAKATSSAATRKRLLG